MSVFMYELFNMSLYVNQSKNKNKSFARIQTNSVSDVSLFNRWPYLKTLVVKVMVCEKAGRACLQSHPPPTACMLHPAQQPYSVKD